MAEGLHIDITGDNSGFINALNGAREGVRATQRQVEESGGSIEKMFAQMKTAAAGVFAGLSAKQFISDVVQIRGQFQQLEASFTTLLGNADKTKSLMAEITDFAAKTPFDLQGVADGARQLLAYGVQANEVTDTLRRLGDIAAGLSIPLNDIVYLYGTTLTQGRMFTQDLRQFTGRGIPMVEELAKQFGVTKDKVGELVTAGKVGSAQMVAAIKDMTDEGGKFGGLMEAQSATITGKISNIEDTIHSMFNEIGKSTEGPINSALDIVSKLVEHWEEVAKVLGVVVTAVGSYKAALILCNAVQKASIVLGEAQAFISLARSITTAKDAMELFNLVTKTSVPGIAVAVIGGLAAAIGLFSDHTKNAIQYSEEFGESASKATSKVNALFAIIDNTDSKSQTHKKAVDDLSDAYKEYGIKLDETVMKGSDEAAKTEELKQKHEALTTAIKNESVEREKANAIKTVSDEYNQTLDDIWQNVFNKHTNNDITSAQAATFRIIVPDSDLLQLQKLDKEMNNLTGPAKRKATEEYGALFDKLKDKILKAAKDMGVGTLTTVELNKVIWSLSNTVGTATDAYNKQISIIDAAASSTVGYKNAQQRLLEIQNAAKQSADELYSSTNVLIKQWNAAHPEMTFSLNVDTSKIPQWIKNLVNMDLGTAKKSLKARQEAIEASREHQKKTGRKLVTKYGNRYLSDNAQTNYEMASLQTAISVAEQMQQKKQTQSTGTSTPKKTTPKRTTTTNSADDKLQAKKNEQTYEELTASTKKDEQRKAVDMEYETRQAILDSRKDSFSKEMDQAQLDYEKEKSSIERWYEDLKDAKIKKAKELFEANPKNKKSVFNPASVDTSYTKEETDSYNTKLQAAEDKRKNKTGDITARRNEAEAQSIQDYLKEYGTMEQKRVALTQEAEAKIKKVRENNELTDKDKEYQVKSIQAGLQKALGELDMEDLKKSINWEYVFGDLDNVDIDTVKAVKEQLQQIVDTCKDMQPDQIKTVTDALDNLQTKIDLSKPIATIKEARKEYKEALKEFNAAKSKRDTAKSTGDTKGEKDATTQMVTASQKMTKAKNKEKKSFESVTKEIDNYAQALTDTGNVVGGATGEVMKLAASAITCGTSMAQAFKKIEEGAKGLERSVAILAIIEAALQAIQIIAKVFGGSEDTTLTSYVDTMKVYIDLLNDSISDLNKSMTSAENTMQDTIKYYRELVSLEKESATAIKSQSQVWLNSGASKGFLGIGSKSSEGVKIRKQIEADLKSGNEEVRKFYEEGFNALNEYFQKVNGYAARSASGFGRMDFIWKLSDDDIIKLSKDTKAMALLGDTLSQAVSDYAAKIKEAKDAQDSMFEILLTVSWDDFRDGFTDAIKDMDKTGKDFANDFAEYMRNALVKNMVAEKYKGKLEELYKKAGVYAEDGDLQSHLDELKDEYKNLAESAHKEVETIDKITGYTESSSSQSGSSGSWQSMGEDTAEELNGRFTALQESGENIKGGVTSMVDALTQLSGKADEGNLTLSEIRNLMVMNNSYLEDILAVNKNYYDKFDKHLGKIERVNR